MRVHSDQLLTCLSVSAKLSAHKGSVYPWTYLRSSLKLPLLISKRLRNAPQGGCFREANSAGKTLLLLDSTSDRIVDTFLMYQRCVAVDVGQVTCWPPLLVKRVLHVLPDKAWSIALHAHD